MKKVEQVTRSGNIVFDYDQILSTKEIQSLMCELFGRVLRRDGKQFILYEKIGILACNVTYLGHPHPLYKKRIQLKKYYLDYLTKNSKNGLVTLYVGIYTYKRTRLFVVFEPATYAYKKSHNSSAHIYSINLQYAQKAGSFKKVDAFGNTIRVYNTYEFVRYIKTLGGENVGGVTSEDIVSLINDMLNDFKNSIPSRWNGIDCYKEMLEANDSNARQGEWQGFYLEYLFKNYIKDKKISKISWNSNKTEGGIDLDFKFEDSEWIYGDLKSDQINHDILGNSFDTLDTVIKEHNGTVYYVCCLYTSEKDSDHSYEVTRFWNSLRDNPYKTDDEIRKRYGVRMKFSVEVKQICAIKIDSITYELLKKNPFAQGRNSNGSERKPKLKVTKDMINALSVYSYELN